MPRSTPDRACRVSSRSFIGAASHCSATLHVCQIMYRPKQFCAWHAMFETEFHPSQTGADHGVVLPSPGCTRFVLTVVCPLETPSTAPRIGLCGERTLRPPRPRVDDDDDDDECSVCLISSKLPDTISHANYYRAISVANIGRLKLSRS